MSSVMVAGVGTAMPRPARVKAAVLKAMMSILKFDEDQREQKTQS